MAALLLLPGFGGQYVSETFSGTGDGADTIDLSRCKRGFSVQLKTVSGSPVGTLQLRQTFGAGYADFSSTIDLSVDGGVTRFPGPLNDPVGKIKLNIATLSGGTVKVYLTGYGDQE